MCVLPVFLTCSSPSQAVNEAQICLNKTQVQVQSRSLICQWEWEACAIPMFGAILRGCCVFVFSAQKRILALAKAPSSDTDQKPSSSTSNLRNLGCRHGFIDDRPGSKIN